MAVKIQFRRDTGTNWTSNNPILLEGELGLNTTTDKFKVGDGTTAWNSLAYVYGDWNTLLNKPATFTPTTENVQDIVGGMVSSNTESGITVTYEDSDGTLDFNVNDPTISLTGDVTGSATMTDLGNVSITTTVAANSVALGTDTTGNYMTDVTAGTGVSVSHTASEGSTATISIGQAVGTTDDPTFNNLTVGGNLTVSGTTTTINTETINLADNIVLINSNETGTPSQDGGIEIERGTSTNKTLLWDESADKWTVGSETFVASTVEAAITGNVTGNVTGDLTGDVTGDLTGNVTGNVTGTITGAASLNVLKAGDTMTGLLTLSGAPTGANHAATKSYVDSVTTAQDLDFQGDTGGALAIDLDSESLTIAGGTGLDSIGSGNTVTINIDSTVATLAGSQVLSNKTLASPVLEGAISGTSIKDEDDLISDSASHLATQQSIKAYVDAQHAAMNELSELTDTVISTPAAGQVLVYDGTNSWDNQTTTIALTGDVSGSANMDASGDVSITATIADDSHNHVIANVDGLQTALDAKADDSTTITAGTGLTGGGTLAADRTFNVDTEWVQDRVGDMFSSNTESGITVTYQDSDGTIDLDVNDPTITLAGDVTGSATMTNLGNVSITATIADDSHNHVIANVDGLQTALDLKAPLASPTLTGTPVAPTAVSNTNTTQIATTAYVQTEITELIGGAPGALDTLNELAQSINDDSSYAATVTTALGTKVATTSAQALSASANAMTISGHTITLNRADGTTDTVTVPDNNTTYTVGDGGLTTNDFTNADHTKLDGIEASADVTDATNVAAAGAVMEADTTTAAMSFVVDEDNMTSDLATKVPTQQSVKAYVDSQVASKDALSELSGTLDDIANGSTYVKSTNDYTGAEKTKLSGIETSATADQTNAEIKTAYEANADTNEFSDAEQTKLSGIETSATADQTNAEIKTAYEANADTNEFSDAEQTKLSGIETSATADQTNAEIKTAYEANADTNEFSDAEQTKLSGIAASAEVNVQPDWNQATTSVDDYIKNKPNVQYTSAIAEGNSGLVPSVGTSGQFLQYNGSWATPTDTDTDTTYTGGTGINIDGANVITTTAIALTTVQTAASELAQLALTTEEGDVVVRSDENKTYVRNSGTAGTMADFTLLATPTDTVLSVNGDTGAVTVTHDGLSDFVANEHIDWTSDQGATNLHVNNYTNTTYTVGDNGLTEKNFTATLKTKLDGIETSATADQTAAEIKTAYEANADTNEFSDAEQTKLSGIETSATADQTAAEIKTAYEANADTNEFSDAEQTKLSGIDTSADVTDATTVAAAGAVMEADTTTAAMSFVVDEDNLSSDSSTKVPTQQSVKAYVDAHTHSGYATMDDVIAMAIALG